MPFVTPPPSPDPAALRRAYLPQFNASDDLVAALWDSLPARGDTKFKYVLMNIVGRSFTTYQATLRLLTRGFVEQAAMLNRSLFEDMVVA